MRSCLYTGALAFAPVSFGTISGVLNAGGGGVLAPANGDALAMTCLIMLTPLIAAGLVRVSASRSHDADARRARAKPPWFAEEPSHRRPATGGYRAP